MIAASGNQHYAASFYTPGYGAFRWDESLRGHVSGWYLVNFNHEFDRMRGIDVSDWNITCVVDDFGDLVRVKK